MAYDEKKDKMLKEWQYNGLCMSVHSYDGGAPKLQVGPRTYPKNDGTVGFSKVGRLSGPEVVWLRDKMPEIMATMAFDGTKQKVRANG